MPIIGIVELTNKTLYGFTSRNVPIYLFRPLDPKKTLFVAGCSQKDRSKNLLALLEPDDMSERIPRGHIVQILGECGDWTVERQAVHWLYQSHRQPKVSLRDLTPPVPDCRLDLRGFRTLHVDPPGCLDIDDCVTFWNGTFVITIADVGTWVLQNPALEEFAINGQTLYDNGVAVRPMFPKELSEDLFTLKPGADRFGLSLVIEKGRDPYWRKSIVCVTESYTYDEANGIPELKQWAEHLADRTLSNDSHEWIEACMLYYNLYMAKQLPEHALIRCHDAPDFEKMTRYSAICPETSRLAESAASYARKDSFKTHWSMGQRLYTHMTSPIRRWADVLNQMALYGHSFNTDPTFLNEQSKRAKKHDRDLFFLDQLRTPKMPLSGVVLEPDRIWVKEWKRLIKNTHVDYEPGTHVKITYYLDMNETTWKRRLITCVDKDCPE
jgi:exoribonuclease R